VFVDALKLRELGFDGVTPAATANGTQNAKASSGRVAIEWPCIGRLLRSRENPTRALEDFRAKSVGGRSMRKRLARSSSIACTHR
jgi:hypothetical protein